ncbi:uncharacterized protein [Salvelinus alpinus]|uniref:uncharacterized protein n=1 Tax=Salvelinus alpinus TaxID=8036 RepID=UPI0039FC4573
MEPEPVGVELAVSKGSEAETVKELMGKLEESEMRELLCWCMRHDIRPTERVRDLMLHESALHTRPEVRANRLVMTVPVPRTRPPVRLPSPAPPVAAPRSSSPVAAPRTSSPVAAPRTNPPVPAPRTRPPVPTPRTRLEVHVSSPTLRRPTCSERSPLPAPDLLPQDYADDLTACSAIIKGDLKGIDKEQLRRLLKTKNKPTFLSEAFYHDVTRNCKTYVTDRGFVMMPLSVEERDFPIAYSMVVHEKIEMFERLLRAVYTPQNVYCVHVDQKSSEEFKTAVKAIVTCFTNVFVASKTESVVYASWSRVQADLNCMKDLLKSPVQWRYLLNTCGTDFPIKTNAEMVQSLKLLNGRNSMESETTVDYKKRRWQYQHNITNNIVVRTVTIVWRIDGPKRSSRKISHLLYLMKKAKRNKHTYELIKPINDREATNVVHKHTGY